MHRCLVTWGRGGGAVALSRLTSTLSSSSSSLSLCTLSRIPTTSQAHGLLGSGSGSGPSLTFVRFFRPRDERPKNIEMNRRQQWIKTDNLLRLGKEPVPRRSEFLEWNYASELYALGARVRENFDDALLREALIDPSYAEAETQRQKELEVDLEPNGVQSNERLAAIGADVLRARLLQYVRAAFPHLPEEGVQAFVQHLMSEQVLSEVGFHLGIKDLIMTEEYPPTRSMHRRAFQALIGALHESDSSANKSRTAHFVFDFVACHLHVQDINELWKLDEDQPMRILMTVLRNSGRGEPEARLLWVSGKETIMACYHVGIYSDKKIIGQAPGESAEIGEEMAARDAIRRLFRTDDARPAMPLGEDLDEMAALPATHSKPNPTVDEWTEDKIRRRVAALE